jgi:peptidoglycan/xylan/chitin deacetylase (PgdA/CDA1 family)
MYGICNLLQKNKCQVYKNEDTKEFYRKYDFTEPNYFLQKENMKDSTKKAESALMSSKAPEDSIPLPIVMYHGLIDQKKYQNTFFINPKIFEKDLIYLSENGYTPIFVRDLISYVDHGTPLPEKPVMITFDDGYYNTYLFTYPLLRQYDMKALISVIGKLTEKYSQINNKNSYYAYLTWNDIREMSASGYYEIQNHSYDLHSNKAGRNGAAQLPGESMEQYRIILNEDLGSLQEKLFEVTGKKPTAFTYPYGVISKNSKEILKDMGFRATFSCREGVNYITRDPDCLYRLKRVCRTPNKSSADFFKVIAPPIKEAASQDEEQQAP